MAGTYDGKTGDTLAWGCFEAGGPFSPLKFNRQPVGTSDVEFAIEFCGICHSDLHTAKGEWGPPALPCVPGHELVGAGVSKFKVGDKVGVGCMVNSCKTGASPCVSCSRGKEQFCREKTVFTYNTKLEGGGHTFGGYSSRMVADERFVLRMPPNLPLAASAPLLCAGITTYAPLVEHGLNVPGTKLAVVGLGGLGSMAVRLAKAFGCVVTVVSHSPRKEAEARALGADAFIVSSDPEAMKAAAGTLDGVVDTVAADHDVAALLGLLATEGKMVLLGVPPTAYTIPAGSIVVGARTLVGSLIGGVQMTQDCLDFCAKHNIVSSIELIPVDKINEAYERLRKNDVNGRFVIDMSTLTA